MPEPQQTTTPQADNRTASQGEPQASLPSVDRTSVLQSRFETTLAHREALIRYERRDLIENHLDDVPMSPQARTLLKETLVKRLDTLKEHATQPSSDTARWTRLSHYALLRDCDPNSAQEFSETANQDATALLGSIRSQYSELDTSLTSLQQLDAHLRDIKLLIGLSPEATAQEAKRSFNAVFQQAASYPKEITQQHIETVLEKTKAFHTLQGEKAQSALHDILDSIDQTKTEHDSRWKSIAACVEKVGSNYLLRSDADSAGWKLSALGAPKADQLHSTQFVFTYQGQPPAAIGFSADALLSLLQKSDSPQAALETRLTAALEDRRKEQDGLQRQFDARLVLDPEQTLYLGVLPQAADRTTTNASFATALMANSILSGPGADDRRDLIISDAPLGEIRKTLSSLVEKNPQARNVVLDINQHGSPEGLLFREKIRAADIRKLAEDFPSLQFQVCTLACNGAGLISDMQQELQQHPEITSRISVLTQTKREMLNVLSSTADGTQSPKTTDFHAPATQLLFIRALLEKPGEVGRAFLRSDFETKEILPLDPEAIIRGNLLSTIPNKARNPAHSQHS